MTTIYGERLLAEAEERLRERRRRRRLLLLFVPSVLIVAVATWETATIRQSGFADAGALRIAIDHVATFGYASVLVGFPLWVAFGAGLHALAASIALVAGPVLAPILFGPGWSPWQRLAVAAVCLLVIAAKRSQPLPATERRPRARRR